ncbi:hypothetical protein PFISCL1PPCAC_17132 [Pristionchus fissidentatus]|uniref:Uncharacterized protein n=1 Tax=Pristionchus fissidentatus TaxID=1538716 RepID=A0AAV5W1Y6_9BILA|nr:hypothetical protein PFISCL1PPCAC_17132 [Pristionchus fissidentatus]
MRMFVKERCCCGCSVTLGSRILATISGFSAFCSLFTLFFYDVSFLFILAQAFYIFATMCAAASVFQAVKTRRAMLMAPMMLISVINIVGLVITLLIMILTMFGVKTYINEIFHENYDYVPTNMNVVNGFKQYVDIYWNCDVDAYARSCGGWYALSTFFVVILSAWVFIVHFDCFRVLKDGEGYPTAQYHGNDDITVPVYPTYPAPAYDAAASSSYPGSTFDTPPSYDNVAASTADETPVKVPLP